MSNEIGNVTKFLLLSRRTRRSLLRRWLKENKVPNAQYVFPVSARKHFNRLNFLTFLEDIRGPQAPQAPEGAAL